jgi:hypothetical protein
MFDTGKTQTPGAATTAAPVSLGAHDVAVWTQVLAQADGPASDAERIDAVRELEQLKCAAEAMQAAVAADLDESQRAVQAAAGVPTERQGRGVAAQVALARRESPHRG